MSNEEIDLIKGFKAAMRAVARQNDDDFQVTITVDERGYHVEVIETADGHTFLTGDGPDIDSAIGVAYASLGAAASEWGYSFRPVK